MYMFPSPLVVSEVPYLVQKDKSGQLSDCRVLYVICFIQKFFFATGQAFLCYHIALGSAVPPKMPAPSS